MLDNYLIGLREEAALVVSTLIAYLVKPSAGTWWAGSGSASLRPLRCRSPSAPL